MNPKQEALFAAAREEKRRVFQSAFNAFVTGKLFLTAITVLTVSALFFFVCAGGFVMQQGIYIGILQKDGPAWQKLVVLGVQMILSAPAFLFCLGLWIIRKKTRWLPEGEPDMSGIRVLKWTNWGVIGLTGVALGIYPTVIIGSGQYLKEAELLRVFYLFVASTLLLIVSAVLIRGILRRLEENVTCCWSDTKMILPLLIVLWAAIVAVLIYAGSTGIFCVAAVCLLGAGFGVLLTYWLFVRKVAKNHWLIERSAVSQMEDHNDPYSRY